MMIKKNLTNCKCHYCARDGQTVYKSNSKNAIHVFILKFSSLPPGMDHTDQTYSY